MGSKGKWRWLDGLIQGMGSSSWFRALGPKVVPKIDKLVHKLSGGKYTMSGGYVPVLMLTAIGRKSGKPRTVPLATMPDGDRFYVVASNFAREDHPAWAKNLLANPDATVDYKRRERPVRARVVEGEEREELWQRLIAFYPPWAEYEERIESHGRDLKIFALEPREG